MSEGWYWYKSYQSTLGRTAHTVDQRDWSQHEMLVHALGLREPHQCTLGISTDNL